MFALAKRNCQLYFSNKASLFFSLLGAWIAFALYIIFLQKNLVDSFQAIKNAEKILDQWVIGGTLAVTSITTTWTGTSRLIRDREKHCLDDFLLTDTSFFSLQMGYLLSSTFIGLIMQIVMYLIMSVYFFYQDGLAFQWDTSIPMLGVMLISANLGASLSLLLAQRFQTSESADRFSIIVGTASGFLVGVYMPIGALPDSAQAIVKITPSAYSAAAFRQILVEDIPHRASIKGIEIKEFLGIGLDWNGLTSLTQNILIAVGIILICLGLLLGHLLITYHKTNKTAIT